MTPFSRSLATHSGHPREKKEGASDTTVACLSACLPSCLTSMFEGCKSIALMVRL